MVSRLRVVTAVIVLGLGLALSGCGGMPTPEDIIDDIDERALVLALRVQDADGNAIGGVRVFVDGRRDYFRTDWEFEPLGQGFPAAWRGWLSNWMSESFALHGPREPERFDIAVSKVGWTEDVTIVRIDAPSFDRYFVRDVMTLYPEGGGPGAVEHFAEVVGE